MPITVTNKELLESLPALRTVAAKEVPLHISLKLRKMLRTINVEVKDFHEEREVLALKCCERDGQNEPVTAGPEGGYKLDPEKRVEFNAGIKELLEANVELTFTKIKPSELGDLKFATTDLLSLDWLIEDEG